MARCLRLFKKSALLRCHLHTIKFTSFKCIIFMHFWQKKIFMWLITGNNYQLEKYLILCVAVYACYKSSRNPSVCSRTYYNLTNFVQNYIPIEEGRDKNFPSSQHVLLYGSQVEGAAQSAAKESSSKGKENKTLRLAAKCIKLHLQSSWAACSGPWCWPLSAPHSQPPPAPPQFWLELPLPHIYVTLRSWCSHPAPPSQFRKCYHIH